MSDAFDAEAVAWLRLVWGARAPRRVVRAAATRWLATGRPLTELFEVSADELARTLDLLPARAEALLAAPAPDPALLDALATAVVRVVPLGSEAYPRVLLRTPELAPPLVLTMQGAVAALARPAVAIIGRRAASSQSLAWAHELAGELARRGHNIVSGNAPGVDRAAHAGAAEGGGPTTGVLAHGLLRRGDDDLDLALAVGHPLAPWRVGLALERNGVLTALAGAVVVVETGTAGGTWRAATGALRQGRPVYVRPGPAGSDSDALLRAGAQPFPDDPAELKLADLTRPPRPDGRV